MLPATQEKYQNVQTRIANGEKLKDAVKAEKMSFGTYYLAKKTFKPKRKYQKKAPSFIDVPLQTQATSEKVVVIVCQTHQLKSLLEGL